MEDAGKQRRKTSEFQFWLRTGRRSPMEYKFNGWHDPEDGKFTHVGGGRYFPPGSQASSGRRARMLNARSAPPTPGAAKPRLSSTAEKEGAARSGPRVPPLPYLSSTHNEIRDLASRYKARPGTEEWTPVKATRYYVGGEDIHAFKAQWVRGHRDAIVAAARRYDLPVELLAGVAYNEVGGAPQQADAIAYSLRSEEGRSQLPSSRLRRPRDVTSLGDLSVQVRRASEALGYGQSERLTESQRRMLLSSLKEPSAGILIAAKHLSDLRNIDFKGTPSERLTRAQIEVIGARYNRGPDLPLAHIRSDLSYGKAITKRWRRLRGLINQVSGMRWGSGLVIFALGLLPWLAIMLTGPYTTWGVEPEQLIYDSALSIRNEAGVATLMFIVSGLIIYWEEDNRRGWNALAFAPLPLFFAGTALAKAIWIQFWVLP